MLLFIISIFLYSPVGSWIDGNTLSIVYEDKIITYNLDKEKSESKTIHLPEGFNPRSYILLKNYFVHTGGGMVYELVNDTIKRIDNSYDHKMQLGSTLFLKGDTIFRYGGYGFFESRNFITYYDNKINEWEVLKNNSKVFPPGSYNSSYFLSNGKFYSFGGLSMDPNNRSISIPNKTIYSFDFKTKRWKFLGQIYEDFLLEKNSIQIENGIIYFSGDQTKFLDIINNELIIYQKNALHRKVHSSIIPPFKYKDHLYYLNEENLTELQKVSIDDFFSSKKLKTSSFYTNRYMWNTTKEFLKNSITFLFLFVVISIILLRNKVLVIKKNLYFLFKRIELTENENRLFFSFVESFKKSNKYEISNKEILRIVDHKELDQGTVSRRKNELINQLNTKLRVFVKTKGDLISSSKSENDKRSINYTLDISGIIFL